MKMKKIITLLSAVALVMTNLTAVSVTSVSAAGSGFTKDFEGYSEVSGSYTLVDTMDDLYADGWSVATDNDFSARNAADQFAQIVNDGGNKVLELTTTKALGIRMDPSTDTPSGSYEISFKFKPTAGGKFDFTLNSFGITGDAVKHNLLYSNNGMRMGHRLNSINVPLTQVGTAENVWYEVKSIINNDCGYYSVELYKEGVFVARRAVINYAGTETIGFLKISGLGSKVLVDDISIKPCEQEMLIYEDDFESYKNVQYATTFAPIGESVNETTSMQGGSYFEGYTPWRALRALFVKAAQGTGEKYDLVHDASLDSQVVRLGDDKSTSAQESSAMILMPLDGDLLNKVTQPKRGKIKLTYKFKDVSSGGYATAVDALQSFSYAGKWDHVPQIAIMQSGTNIRLTTTGSPITLNKALWYDAEVIFDVITENVSIVIKDHSTGNEIANFSHSGNLINSSTPTLQTLKAINIRAIAGSTLYIDDFKMEYYIVNPEISASTMIITDYKGDTVTDKNNIPAALTSIEIPFGCEMTTASTNASTVVIEDSNGNPISYTPAYSSGSYTIFPDDILTPGEEYTLKVPKTVENSFGRQLGTDFEYSFTIASEYPELIDIGSISVAFLSDVTNGSTIDATIEYANTSSVAITGMPFIAYYGDDMLLATSSVYMAPIAAGAKGTAVVTFTVPSALQLDLDKVDKMSVCLWKGFQNSAPHCEEVDFEAASPVTTSATTEEEEGNSISKPKVTYSYVDSTLNISGTANSDSKYVTIQMLTPGNTFAAGEALGNPASDSLVFYRAQVPVTKGKYSLDVRFDLKANPSSTLVEGDYPTAMYVDDTKLDISKVYLASYNDYVTAVAALNAAAAANDLATFESVLNTNRSTLNFTDSVVGTAAVGDEITPYFNDVKANPLDPDNEVQNAELFNSYVAMNALNGSTVTNIADNINDLAIDSNLKALCNEILETNEKGQHCTSLLSGKSIGTISGLEQSIKEAIILTAAKYGNGYGQLKKALENYGASIGIATPISVDACKNLMGNTYTNAASFKSAYTSAVTAAATTTSSSKKSDSTTFKLPVDETNPVIPEAKPVTKTFNDIDNYEWAMEGIMGLADRNIISGVDEDRFEPGRNIKREEFAKIIVAALGASDYEYGANIFGDASDGDWFVKYINIAAELGIVKGVGDGLFGAGNTITRQDMAVMIYNALKYRNVDMPLGDFKFDDDGQIADYAKDAVAALHEMGAINGVTKTTFDPNGLATRAQAARIVYSVLKELQD